MKILSYLFLINFLFVSCDGQEVKTEQGIKSKLVGKVYTILNMESNELSEKLTTHLELADRLSEDTLRLIAEELKQSNPTFKTLFIFHHLNGEDVNSIAWATTHYTPELTVNIQGATREKASKAQVEKFGLTMDERKEIFVESYNKEVNARKKADAKYPMTTSEEVKRDSQKYANYKNELMEEAQKEIMKKYNLPDNVYWEISTEGVELGWIPTEN